MESLVNFPIQVEIVGGNTYTIGIDVPDYESAIYEMKKLAKEVCSLLSIREALSSNPQRAIMIEVECLGYEWVISTVITPEFIETVKKNEQVEEKSQKMVDLESVKHDIGYAINMLRSLYPEDSKEWTTNQVLTWLYYILHKQFGEPLPEEIQKAQSNLVKEKKDDSRPS